MAVLSPLVQFFSRTVFLIIFFFFFFFFLFLFIFLFVLDEIVARGFARLPGKFVCGWLGFSSQTDAYSARKRCSLNSLVSLGLCLSLRMFELQRTKIL